MSNTRKCWIDDGVSPIYEAWVSDITDTGATIELEAGKTLPATFSVYFDENQYVGRTSKVSARDGDTYLVLFTGRTPRPPLF